MVEDVPQLHADDEAGHAEDDVAPEQHVHVVKQIDHQLRHLEHQLGQVHQRPWRQRRETAPSDAAPVFVIAELHCG